MRTQNSYDIAQTRARAGDIKVARFGKATAAEHSARA